MICYWYSRHVAGTALKMLRISQILLLLLLLMFYKNYQLSALCWLRKMIEDTNIFINRNWTKWHILIERIKTTPMENASTGVLEQIKDNIQEMKIKPQSYMMYQDIYNCICQNTKK